MKKKQQKLKIVLNSFSPLLHQSKHLMKLKMCPGIIFMICQKGVSSIHSFDMIEKIWRCWGLWMEDIQPKFFTI